MAEANFNDLAGPGLFGLGAGLTPIINGLGAVFSLTLVAGVVVWGYQLAVRDVTGVPVIKALDGPMREQPADPGGLASDHMGLAVNSVQAVGEAERPADRLVLAPTAVSLSEDDQPVPTLMAEAEAEAELAVLELTPEAEISDALARVEGEDMIRTAEDMAVAAALSEALAGEDVEITQVVDASSDPLDDLPAPKTSLPPALRPSGATALAPVDADVDPATLPLGTRLVQLGAFASEGEARTEWARLAEGYEPFMADKQRVIQKTESSGRVFYRLRAVGFADMADARRFCASILASEATCIPVLTR